MTEISVAQRSGEWFRQRQRVQLTASRFGDAIGVGQGRPYDFLLSLLSDDPCHQDDADGNQHTRHGTEMEPIIDEAYQLLTGNITHATGFWLPPESSVLHGLCGASPDGKILSDREPKTLVGLVEYKAPVYQMFDPTKHPHGIPRHYMAQIQGQMAICGASWCDFMAVCTKTKSVSLQRVTFNRTYWQYAAKKLQQFSIALGEAKRRREKAQQHLNFPGVQRLKGEPIARALLPGENSITVENLLEVNSRGQFRSSSGMWLGFDVLMGSPTEGASSLKDCEYEWFLRDIDSQIRNSAASDCGPSIG